MSSPKKTVRELIDRFIQESGASDALSAVRMKADELIDLYVQIVGEPEEMPLDLLMLASLRGIRLSETAPMYSPDAEIAPDSEGRVEMRLNPDRPETRLRFSIGHEITHTFFPDHASQVWPRADSRYRDLSDPNDYLEMLCDAGAAELVLPRRWFAQDAARIQSAAELLALARKYKASPEATLRRYVELHDGIVVAVVFNWKLKPSQMSTVGNIKQDNLFGLDPVAEAVAARRLRVEYAIPSPRFATAGLHVPRDKSVKSEGPLYEAAATQLPTDAESDLDLGPARGRYRVLAVPLWTADGEKGPRGECAVAAILRPLAAQHARRKTQRVHPGLFEE